MALIYPQNGDLKKLLKSSRKKVPQSARLSAGGGVQKLKGQCPNAPSMNLRKASLTRSTVCMHDQEEELVVSGCSGLHYIACVHCPVLACVV